MKERSLYNMLLCALSLVDKPPLLSTTSKLILFPLHPLLSRSLLAYVHYASLIRHRCRLSLYYGAGAVYRAGLAASARLLDAKCIGRV
jgi:hypothetical protein